MWLIRNRRIGSFMLGIFLVVETALAEAYSAADYLDSSGSLSSGAAYPGYSNLGNLNQGSLNSYFSNTGYANVGYLNAGSSNPGYLGADYSNLGYSNPVPVKPPCSLYRDCSARKEVVTFATDNTTCYVFYNECFLYNENCDRQNRNVAELHEVSRSNCTKLCSTQCTAEYKPVCAVYRGSKQEFANSCILSSEICTKGIPYQFLNDGICPSVVALNYLPIDRAEPVIY